MNKPAFSRGDIVYIDNNGVMEEKIITEVLPIAFGMYRYEYCDSNLGDGPDGWTVNPAIFKAKEDALCQRIT